MKKIIIFIAVLIPTILFGQEQIKTYPDSSNNITSSQSDSITYTNDKFLKLSLYPKVKNDFIDFSMYSNPKSFNLFLPYSLKYYYKETVHSPNSIDYNLIRSNLHNTMKLIPEFQKKKDLGVFGKILGYTNAAATIGLLIYHLHKYKDDY